MLKLPYRAIQQMQRKTTKLTCISNTPSISLARRIIFALLCGYCFPNSTFILHNMRCAAAYHNIIPYASFSEMCIFSWNFQTKIQAKTNKSNARVESPPCCEDRTLLLAASSSTLYTALRLIFSTIYSDCNNSSSCLTLMNHGHKTRRTKR